MCFNCELRHENYAVIYECSEMILLYRVCNVFIVGKIGSTLVVNVEANWTNRYKTTCLFIALQNILASCQSLRNSRLRREIFHSVIP